MTSPSVPVSKFKLNPPASASASASQVQGLKACATTAWLCPTILNVLTVRYKMKETLSSLKKKKLPISFLSLHITLRHKEAKRIGEFTIKRKERERTKINRGKVS
ncbi:mCG147967 [Mus musculus]|jgi:hypothetical protein|nr:mCG147967 [Mus musculus]